MHFDIRHPSPDPILSCGRTRSGKHVWTLLPRMLCLRPLTFHLGTLKHVHTHSRTQRQVGPSKMSSVTLPDLPVELIGKIVKGMKFYCYKNADLKNVRLVCRELDAKTLTYFGDEFLRGVTVSVGLHCFHILARIAEHPVFRKSVRHISFHPAGKGSSPAQLCATLECCGNLTERYIERGFDNDLNWCLQRLSNLDGISVARQGTAGHLPVDSFNSAIQSVYSAVISQNIHLKFLSVTGSIGFPFEQQTPAVHNLFDQLSSLSYKDILDVDQRVKITALSEMLCHAPGLKNLSLDYDAAEYAGDIITSMSNVDIRSRPLYNLQLTHMSIAGGVLAQFLKSCSESFTLLTLGHVELYSGKSADSFGALEGHEILVSACMYNLDEGKRGVSFERVHRQLPVIEQEVGDGQYFIDMHDHEIPPDPYDTESGYAELTLIERELAGLDNEILWGYDWVGYSPWDDSIFLHSFDGDDVKYAISLLAENYTLTHAYGMHRDY
ncbi:hypothetical protein BDV96DRAFT_102111 [Lophiotrema nucula]|uniref:Uncharacterized protein n=1 Tax=Lophiotrema nucula TaxID=690887 RepID=A0A6A5Z5L6_9PLEO|nr:hypothetical protein BDV96DRAFT_102111 [Lophiotrema nucula]